MTAPQPLNQGPAYWRKVAEQIARQTFGDNSPLVPIFLAMIQQESSYNPAAVSSAGAMGIAQFMPATAQALGINPWDPYQALSGAARHLRNLVAMFGGDVVKGTAAYNAGPKTIQDAVAAAGDAWLSSPIVKDETRTFIRNIFGGKAAQEAGVAGSIPSAGSVPGAGSMLGNIVSGILGASSTADRNDPLVQELERLRQQVAQYNARIEELSKKPNLTEAEQKELGTLNYSRNEALKQIIAISNAIKPTAGESPANLINAIGNIGALGLSIAHTAFADQMTALNFILDVIKENNRLVQDRFANLLALHRATTEDLQAIVAARHLLQADQLAIAVQALARAGFIAQQRAWNATHLFFSATGTQPGFGLDDPPARALAAMGMAPSPDWGRMPAVNPEDFDPIRILQQAQQTITGTTEPIVSKVPTEEDYGIPQLQAQARAAAGLASAIPAGTPITPPSISAPNYDAVLAQVFGPMANVFGGGAGAGAGQGQEQGREQGQGQEQKPGISPGLVPGPDTTSGTGSAMPGYAPSGRSDRWEIEQRSQREEESMDFDAEIDRLFARRFGRYRRPVIGTQA